MEAVKTIGRSGQISLGKQYAGQRVLVEEREPGVWLLKLGRFVPNNELWIHQEENRKKIDEGVAWAEKTPFQETDVDELMERYNRMHGTSL